MDLELANSFPLMIEHRELAYNDAITVSANTHTGRLCVLITCAILWSTPALLASEHPGLVDKDCPACHEQKVTGKSVHSAMDSPCTVCHVRMTQGDMTTVSLSMPKTKICSACHNEATALRQHVPPVKGQCLECHDAHSSRYRMLLLRDELQTRSAAIHKR